MALESDGDLSLHAAWFLMSHIKTRYNDWIGVTEEEYAEAREAYAKILREKEKGKPMPENARIANAKYLETVKIPVRCIETGQ